MLWYIALGSAIGGVARYMIGTLIQTRAGADFPTGTMVVNLTGSLLLGFLLRAFARSALVSPEIAALLTTGLCGGYTTFSTYSYETAALIEDGRYTRAAVYVTLSVGLALVGVFVGFALARGIFPIRQRL